jgi:MscS family membrane protein
MAAAGGVGGLVVGLASKELVENLFGGVALLFTSPFSPGDVVTTSAFSGRIEKIGFYTTNIVDFEGGSALVPNSLITSAVITNLTRASRRRFASRYALRYGDLPAVPKIVATVRERLLAHPLTDTAAYMRSHLTSFGPYSLILEAQCLVKTNSRDEFLDFQQDALLIISDTIAENGAEFETEFPPLLRDGDGNDNGMPVPAQGFNQHDPERDEGD